MNIIKEATRDCPRDDCSIIMSGGMSTCMGYTPTYDKSGNRNDAGDPNIHTQGMRCGTCNKMWTAQTQYGKTTLTAHDTAHR